MMIDKEMAQSLKDGKFDEVFKERDKEIRQQAIKDFLKELPKEREIPFIMNSIDDINAHPKEAEVYDRDCGFNFCLQEVKKVVEKFNVDL